MKLLKRLSYLVLFFSLLNACKKNDRTEPSATEDPIAKVREALANRPYQRILATNLQGESFLCNEAGEKIDPLAAGKLMSSCTDEYGDPIYSYDETVLLSCMRTYICGQGNKIKSTFKIITPLQVIPTGSRGWIRLKNSLGTVLLNMNNITPVSITNLPVDSRFPSSNVFKVEYESNWITTAEFSSTTTVENNLVLANDCSGSGGTPSPIATQFLSSFVLYLENSNVNPCLRVDAITIYDQVNGGGGIPQSIAGVNAVGACYSSGFDYPSHHDIELTDATTGIVYDWNPAPGITEPYKTILSSELYLVNSIITPNLTIPAGSYYIRYRNRNGICTGPWYSDPGRIATPYIFN